MGAGAFFLLFCFTAGQVGRGSRYAMAVILPGCCNIYIDVAVSRRCFGIDK